MNLGLFNVIIGANASGKSNIVSLFKFLHDISTNGLDDAISRQGGLEWVANANLNSELIKVEVCLTFSNFSSPFPTEWESLSESQTRTYVQCGDMIYNFTLKCTQDNNYMVIEESLKQDIKFLTYKGKNKDKKLVKKIEGTAITEKQNNTIITDFQSSDSDELTDRERDLVTPKQSILSLEVKSPLNSNTERELVILSGKAKSFSAYIFTDFFKGVQLFDIDPKLAKNSYSISGKNDLEWDGSNLALVLSKLLKDNEKKDNLLYSLRSLLPYIKDMSIKQFDRSVMPYLKESYFENKLIPANLISDGSINLITLLVALYSKEGGPTLILEEPDKNIHPSLISKTVELLKDYSKTYNRQILITTHNPEFVKEAKLENLIFVSRDKCFSKVTKPADSNQVKEFLAENLGIDTLYIQNLLSG